MGPTRPIVVIVEDDVPIANSLSRIVDSRGFEPRVAASGQLAVDIVRDEGDRVAYVILDILLPESSGVEVGKKILGVNKDTKIIVSTAAEDSKVYKDLVSLGINTFLRKPYEISELDDVLKVDA